MDWASQGDEVQMKLSLAACGFVCISSTAMGGVVQSEPTAIQNFYGYDNDIALFVQNRPKGCEDGFWIRHSDPQYSDNLKVITSAVHAGSKVSVKAFDDSMWPLFEGKVCRVQSVSMEGQSTPP